MNKFLISLSVVLAGLFFIPATVQANILDKACEVDPSSDVCKSKNDKAENIVSPVVNLLFWLVGVLSVIMLIWGGIRYATSAGDSNKVTGAKNTIIYSIVGLAVALLSYAIVSLVVSSSKNNFGPPASSTNTNSGAQDNDRGAAGDGLNRME